MKFKSYHQTFDIDFERFMLVSGYHVSPVVKRYNATNAKSFSAIIRDEMGLEQAQEALFKAGIPHDSELWCLNHHNSIPSDAELAELNNLEIVRG